MVRGQGAPHDRHRTTSLLLLIHFFFSRSDRQSHLPSDLISVTPVEPPPPISSHSTRLEGDPVAMAAANAPISMREALTVNTSSPSFPMDLAAEQIHSLWTSVFAAHQPGHRAAVRHLHQCHHGVGEVHLRPRDVPAEQRRHHRHGHAHAAAPTPHHRRLRPHEPKRQDPSAQRYPDLPLARISPTPSRPGGSPGITPTPLAYLND
jgi:hypothetical protein